MAKITFKVWDSQGNLADADSVSLCDKGSVYGIKRNDSGVVVVAANTALQRTQEGVYEIEWVVPANGIQYTGWVKVVYEGRTVYYEVIYTAIPAAVGPSTSARAKRVYDMIQRKGLLAIIRTYPLRFFNPDTNTTTLGDPVDYELKIIPPYDASDEVGKNTLIVSGRGMTGIPAWNIGFAVDSKIEVHVLNKTWMVQGVQPLTDSSGVLCYMLEILSN